MGPDTFCQIFVFFGIIVTYTSGVDGINSHMRGRSRHNSKIHRSHPRLSHDRLKTISKHVLRTFDTSCIHIPLPNIPNGKVFKIHKKKTYMENMKTKDYLIAEFRCQKGYMFVNKQRHGNMFCSKSKWIGKKPVCEKSVKGFMLQNDEAISTFSLPPRVQKCPPDHKIRCKHLCYILDGKPTCGCPTGFQEVGNDCLDINECESDNAGCHHGCTNTLGSYSCTCPEGYRLSFDSKACEDVNECHLRNGHGPCQDTCRNTVGSYECGCATLNGTRLAGDRHTCADIDECIEGGAGCSHACVNTLGRAYCVCPDGMRIGEDLKTCEDINECEDPKIKAQCPSGCLNFIGSYYCPTVSEEYLLADEPSKESNRVDENDDDEYEDYEEGDYDDDYDEGKSEGEKNSTKSLDPVLEKEDMISVRENENNNDKTITGKRDETKNESAKNNTSMNVIDQRIQVTESDKSVESGNYRKTDSKENAEDSDSYDDEDYEESDYEDEYNEDGKLNISEETTTQRSISTASTQSIASTITTRTPSSTNKLGIDVSKEIGNVIPNKIDDKVDSEKSSESTSSIPFTINTITTTAINSVEGVSFSNISDTIQNRIYLKEKTDETDEKNTKNDEEDEDNYDDDYDGENATNIGRTNLLENVIGNNVSAYMNETNYKMKNKSDMTGNENTIYDETEKLTNPKSDASSTYSTTTSLDILKINNSDDSNNNKNDTFNYHGEENRYITEKSIVEDIIEKNDIFETDHNRANKTDDVVEKQSEIDEEYDEDDYEDYDETTTTTSVKNSKIDTITEVTTPTTVTPSTISKISTESSDGLDTDSINLNRRVYQEEKEGITPANTLVDVIDKGEVDKYTTERIDNRAPENDHDNQNYDEDITITVKPLEEKDLEDITTTDRVSSKTSTIRSLGNVIDNHIIFTEEKLKESDESTDRSSTDEDSPRRSKPSDDNYDYDDDDEYEEYEDSKTEESEIVNKEIKKCEEGYKLNEQDECTDIDECNPDTNPCSDTCQNTPGSYTCSCPSGFRLSPADSHICQDIDECQDNPCSHTCINSEGSYKCDCPKGLTLQNTTSCVNLTCSHGETKINGKIQCTCPSGYVLGFDNRTCEDVNECLLINDCAHSCHNTEGSYICSCRQGYVLENERLCIDIDECQGNHGCPHDCVNAPGSFKCACREGYEFVNATNSCVDIDECDVTRDLDECDQICINYEGGYECECRTGYELGSDDATCEDIKECAVNNGNCSQICEDLPGSYACKCIENYALNEDRRTCRIVDPCLVENGGCSHHCFNINGSIRCSCPEGYELTLDQKTCTQINPCTIRNGGCSHFCEFVDGHANCMCPELYTLQNKTHCAEVNPCWENNGGCSHICRFEDHKQSCLCPLTHELQNRTHCLEKNPCLTENGGCSDTCDFSKGILSCSCPEDYYLEGKTCYKSDPCLIGNGGCSHDCFSDEDGNVKCLCPQNFVIQKNQKICIPQDLCLLNNGNCSHSCDSSNNQVTCSCPEGFQLQNRTQCVQSNPCSTNNGGCSDICENFFGTVKCACPDNYALEDNNNCVIIDNCLEDNGGCSHFCKTVDKQIQCSCPDRYNLVNQTKCIPLNPCFINNGGCSHECSAEGNKVTCSCPEGHELEGKKCILINPCDHKNGGCSHVCTSINGLMACKCPPGFELINKTCFKKNPCSINNGGCSHGCTNVRGQAKCSCPPGYKLFAKMCLDDDPCKKNNGGCSHICQNQQGKRECSCPPGYLLRPNRRVCKEVNECRVNRGGCSHGCKNLPGSFQCTCPHGLKLDQVNNKTCVDIDECRIDNGKCEMICRNFKGGHKCDCPEGYTLQKDKRSCRLGVVTQCKVPLAPKHGVMRCSDQIMEHGTLVPSGTRCNFWCNEGYKLKGRSPRHCSSTGEWESDEPKCIVATCPKLPPIKNGWYLPGVCNSGRTYSGESCEIYCRKGFKPRQDIEKYVCDANMQWMPNVRIENLQDACISGLPNIHLKCPRNGHIEFILPEGQRHMLVKIPRPETSVDWTYVTSQPSWGTRLETTLPAGRTEVRFTAVSPNDFNTTASCHLVINVLDKELPKVMDCPSNIERSLSRGQNMQVIHWREPIFSDNVGVATIYKSRDPGGEFGLGLHHITYVGSDEAGNRAFCHFSINIRDDLELEESNSVQQYSSTYTNHNSAGRYRAVLICPSGVQYMSNPPDSYNNMLTSEAGCYWRHVKVTRPMQPQSFKVPKVYTESRLPSNMKSNRRVFFKWNR